MSANGAVGASVRRQVALLYYLLSDNVHCRNISHSSVWWRCASSIFNEHEIEWKMANAFAGCSIRCGVLNRRAVLNWLTSELKLEQRIDYMAGNCVWINFLAFRPFWLYMSVSEGNTATRANNAFDCLMTRTTAHTTTTNKIQNNKRICR